MASCKRAPFDLAEAESELVAGFHTEYSGFRWLVIFMAEYGSMFAVSGIASIMFLGGWSIGVPWELAELLKGTIGSVSFAAPFVGPGAQTYTIDFGFVLGNVINVIVFIAKGWFLVFVMMWVRWTLPRLRIDQVMMTCLKYLLPISCVLLMGVSLWQLVLPAIVITIVRWVIFALAMVGLAYLLSQLFTMAKAPPGTGMPGVRRLAGLPGYGGPGQGAKTASLN
jgi:NADH-quinone oxidoreductase subunit H